MANPGNDDSEPPDQISARQIARKLGNLTESQNELIRDLILSRGGSGSNVRLIGSWADRTLLDAAKAAVAGDIDAEKAVKIVKQAKRLGQAY